MVTIFYEGDDGYLNALELDAAPQESHSHAAQATEFPVETGAVVADHVIQKPDVVKIEGIVTETPLPRTGSDFVTQYESGTRDASFRRPNDAYVLLLQIKEQGRPVRLSTTRREYADMVLETIEASDSAERGGALFVSLSFKQVTVAATERVAVASPKNPSHGPKKSKGKQATEPAKGVPDSVARDLFNAVTR